jgi:hypothetical protein
VNWLLVALWLVACATPIRAQHDFDASAPFSRYETFAWVTEEPLIRPVAGVTEQPQPSPLLDPLIRAAVERDLATKGYQRVPSAEQADLVVSFSVGAREKIEVDSYPAHLGYHYGARTTVWGRGWYSETRTYSEGTLALDFFDRKTRNVVWHGVATRRLPGRIDPDQRRAIVDAAVDAILEEFPARGEQGR